MSRYEAGTSDEFEPGSNSLVLRNHRGILLPEVADAEEARLLLVAQARSYSQIQSDTRFDFRLICDLHRSWLGGLYPMAGELRKVDVSKDGFLFAPLGHIETSLTELDNLLTEETPCEAMSKDRLVTAISRAHAELLLVHPFREGNGRLARWIADLMALQAGFPTLNWEFERDTDHRRNRYFQALRRGYGMDFKPLEALIRKALTLSEASS